MARVTAVGGAVHYSGGVRVWMIGVVLGLGGCFVQVDDPEPEVEAPAGPCDAVACSDNGYCEEGTCFCDPYYVGNPNALHGCQPAGALGACETTCGLNAFCDDGACVCAEDFVAVCGTGDCMPQAQVCDGIDDCLNENDENPEVCEVAEVQQWTLADGCDDGLDIEYRLWAQDRGWVWPSLDEAFITEGVDVLSRTTIECVRGETICLGAEVDGVSWGVGLSGAQTCADCCRPCQPGVVEFGTLACG